MKKIFRKNQVIVTALALMIAVAGYLTYTDRNLDDEQVAEEAGAELLDETYDVTDDGTYELSEEDIFTDTEDNTAEVDTSGTDTAVEDTATADGTDTAEAATTDGTDTAAATTTDGTDTAEAATTDGTDTAAATTDGTDTVENAGEAVFTGSTVTNLDYAADVKLAREQVRAQNKETLLEIINNENIEEASKQEAVNQMIAMTGYAEKENAAELLLEAKGFTDVVVSMSADSVDVVLNMGEVTDAKRAQVEDIVKRKTEVSAENIVITPISVTDSE